MVVDGTCFVWSFADDNVHEHLACRRFVSGEDAWEISVCSIIKVESSKAVKYGLVIVDSHGLMVCWEDIYGDPSRYSAKLNVPFVDGEYSCDLIECLVRT